MSPPKRSYALIEIELSSSPVFPSKCPCNAVGARSSFERVSLAQLIQYAYEITNQTSKELE